MQLRATDGGRYARISKQTSPLRCSGVRMECLNDLSITTNVNIDQWNPEQFSLAENQGDDSRYHSNGTLE